MTHGVDSVKRSEVGALGEVSKMKKSSFRAAKANSIPVLSHDRGAVSLVPIGPWILAEDEIIKLMAIWRADAKNMFLAQFESTEERTRNYLESLAIMDQARLLFLILLKDDSVGHIGFANIGEFEAELDNVMKSTGLVFPGLMLETSSALLNWGFYVLGLESVFLRVTSHNAPAKRLYDRLGFMTERREPLKVEMHADQVLHVPCRPAESDAPFELVRMRLDRVRWQSSQFSNWASP